MDDKKSEEPKGDEILTESDGTSIYVEGVSIGGDDILDLLPHITLFPGEDEMTYEGLLDAYLSDLNPGSPYETSVV